MRTATVTTVLDAPAERVFEYMAEVENLPEWATEFARELRREGDDYKVRNGLGPDTPDELSEAQHASLLREMAGLERLIAG